MFFSVLIPVYQVEKYLRQCVESVLSQSEKDFEIVLVDDGSTDHSGEICDEYARHFPNTIRVIHQKNQGLLLARRSAIKSARGEWFVHLDSDDYMLPGALREIRETIQKNDADLILCKVAYGAKDGVTIVRESELPFYHDEVFENKEKLYMQFLYGGQLTAIYQKIARREIVDVEKDYWSFRTVSIMEDHLQSLPLLDRSRRPVFMDRSVVYYRMNEDSMTRQKDVSRQMYAFHSVCSVYKEEEKYLSKWQIGKDEEKTIFAKHMRKLCVALKSIASVQNKSYEWKRFLNEIAEDVFLRNEFYHACRKDMGAKTTTCFFLLFHHCFFPLRFILHVG